VTPRPSARAYLALFAIALVASALVGSHGLAYWDAGDYVREAIRGEGSGLLLGRPLFLAAARGVVRAAIALGAPPSSLEPILRWVACAAASTAAPLLCALASRVGASPRGAILAGLALALAPSFAHTAHQVLTDAPAVALSLLALFVAAGQRRSSFFGALGHGVLAGALLGAATATRETAVVHLLAVVVLVRRPASIFGVLVAYAAALALALAAGRGVGLAMIPGWLRAMRGSAARNPLTARDVALAFAWLLSIGPAPLLAALIGVRRDLARRADPEARRRLALALPSLAAACALLAYPDGAFSPRYFLAVTPVLLVASAPVLDGWLAAGRRGPATALASLAMLGLLAVRLGARPADRLAEEGRAMHGRLAAVPDGALVIPGHLCPAYEVAEAARDVERRPIASRRYGILCPGWGWPEPDALARTLDEARCAGRAVAIDARDVAWVGARETRARDEVRAYIAGAGASAVRVDAGFAIVSPRRCP
jgi:hypothetical protein